MVPSLNHKKKLNANSAMPRCVFEAEFWIYHISNYFWTEWEAELAEVAHLAKGWSLRLWWGKRNSGGAPSHLTQPPLPRLWPPRYMCTQLLEGFPSLNQETCECERLSCHPARWLKRVPSKNLLLPSLSLFLSLCSWYLLSLCGAGHELS